MVEDELKVYLDANPTPESDVLATYEFEYSAKDKAGVTHSAKRILDIGTCRRDNVCVCLWLEIVDELAARIGPNPVIQYYVIARIFYMHVQYMRRRQRSR